MHMFFEQHMFIASPPAGQHHACFAERRSRMWTGTATDGQINPRYSYLNLVFDTFITKPRLVCVDIALFFFLCGAGARHGITH
jgi:hypothetical protein